jgi:hypothetical protein
MSARKRTTAAKKRTTTPPRPWAFADFTNAAAAATRGTEWRTVGVRKTDRHWELAFEHARGVFVCAVFDAPREYTKSSRAEVQWTLDDTLSVPIRFARFSHGDKPPQARVRVSAMGRKVNVGDFDPGMSFIVQAVDHAKKELVLGLTRGWPWRASRD